MHTDDKCVTVEPTRLLEIVHCPTVILGAQMVLSVLLDSNVDGACAYYCCSERSHSSSVVTCENCVISVNLSHI